MDNYYIASCSCGKDSLAMVLRLIEEKRPLHEILFYDTGMEFQAIYDNWIKLKTYAEARGIKCTVLKPKNPFLYDMLERPIIKNNSVTLCGYGWCGGLCRWGTTFKISAMNKYKAIYNDKFDVKSYVGIAVDETKRLNASRGLIYPLADWGMTEADCLSYCREHNIKWTEYSPETATGEIDLYDILDRVSCWCCRNKNLWELRNIWHYLPKYWQKLKDLQAKNERPFKKAYSIFDLEERFENGYEPKHRRKAK